MLDLAGPDGPLHEHLARMVAERAPRLVGDFGPQRHRGGRRRDRAALPGPAARADADSIFLVPGVGAQGGSPDELGPAFSDEPASVLVAASRSIAGAADPAAAAAELRDRVWAVSQSAAR